MTDWLRFIAMIFYAPLRGMREVRDRGGLLPAFVCAYASQIIYLFALQWLTGDRTLLTRPSVIGGNLFQAATALLPFVIVFVPLIALVANVFDRRGSFGVVLQQEYASLASVVLYALIAANLVTILISLFFHFSGVQGAYVANSIQSAEQIKSLFNLPADIRQQLDQELRNPAFIAGSLFRTVKIGIFTIGAFETVRKVFRLSFLKSIAVVLLSYAAMLALSPVWTLLFHRLIGSPFLLLLLFFLLRGYFTGMVNTQRARAA